MHRGHAKKEAVRTALGSAEVGWFWLLAPVRSLPGGLTELY